MKKVYSFAVALLLIICAFFTSCGGNPTGLSENPNTNDLVYGNGGIVAIKGEYLYFVNGYQDSSKFSNYKVDNVEGKVERGAIYRTKLDKDGNVQHDENGFLTNCDLVVSKTVGFDNGGFYIIGDYIYFLTPHMEKDSDGKLQSSWLDICKIKIDGSGKSTRLYYTTNNSTAFDWSTFIVDNTPYLVVLDGKKLVSINCENKKVITLSEEATSVAFPEYDKFGYTNSSSKYVYFTRAKNDNDKLSSTFSGNVVCKVSVTDANESESYINNQNTSANYKLVKIENDFVYYEVKDINAITYVCKKNVKEDSFLNATQIQITQGEYSSYLILAQNPTSSNITKLIGVDKNYQIMYVTKNDNNASSFESKMRYKGASEIKLIGVQNDVLYFIESDAIYSINILDESSENTLVSNGDKTYKLDVMNLINVVDNKVYILSAYTPKNSEDKNYYLNVITTTKEKDEAQFLGKFAENETPANPNDDLEEGEDPILPYIK